MSCGIYQIKNKINQKIYVGSSINVNKRLYKHLWMLRRGDHDNIHLQNSFNEYGENCFDFSLIEHCDCNDLINRENHYISFFSSCNDTYGYNLASVNEFRRNTYNDGVKVKLSKYNLNKNGNITKFSLTNIDTNQEFIFDNLVDCANYLIKNGFSKGNPRNIRMKISSALRGIKVNNGYNGSIRKTCYKHKFKIINEI
jgi:group I intron endonuclease